MANFHEALAKLKKEKHSFDKRRESFTAISTGSFVLDYLTGINGFPIGGISELAGDNSVGKTTICGNIIRNAQKMFPDKRILVVDAEQCWDLKYMEKLGVDFSGYGDTFLHFQEMIVEDVFQVIRQLGPTGEFSVIIVDSVGPLMPRVKFVGEDGANAIGLQARALTPEVAVAASICSKYDICGIFVNQFRAKLDFSRGGSGATKDVAGGNALKYYRLMSMWLERSTVMMEEALSEISLDDKVAKEIERVVIRANMYKNKCAPEGRKGKFVIKPGFGIDNVYTLIELAIKQGSISKSGNYFSIPDGTKIMGKENLWIDLSSKKELRDSVADSLGLKNFDRYCV